MSTGHIVMGRAAKLVRPQVISKAAARTSRYAGDKRGGSAKYETRWQKHGMFSQKRKRFFILGEGVAINQSASAEVRAAEKDAVKEK